MSILNFFVFFCVINCALAFIEQLVYKNIAPKCCKKNNALLYIGSDHLIPYMCAFDINRTSHILTTGTLSNFPWSLSEETSCVDDVIYEYPEPRQSIKIDGHNLKITRLYLKAFPKCCPEYSVYDLVEHKCVSAENATDIQTLTDETLSPYINRSLILLKIGLSTCNTVISDYQIDTLDDLSYQEDQSVFIEKLGKSFPTYNYCIDKIYKKNNYVVRACENLAVCKRKKYDMDKVRCVRKCCEDGYYYKGGGKCKFGFIHGMNLYNDSKIRHPEVPFATVHGHKCRHYMVSVDWNYHLDEAGFLNLNLEDVTDSFSPLETSYCFEYVDTGVIQSRRLFLCFKHDTNNSIKFQISRIALSLSCVFLILTLLGYFVLPEMQNLHGKTLMCNCASLLVAFSVLVLLQFYPTIKGPACKAIGYLTMYTFLAAFMWANVMSFDIWWTFGSAKNAAVSSWGRHLTHCMGSVRVHGINQKRRECRRFLWYCLYAWTVPVIITGSAFTIQHFGHYFPDVLQPFVPVLGGFACFFEESTNLAAFLTWFTLPIAVICVCNLVLFIKTILYCYKVKNEIESMKDTQLNKNERKKILTADKERLSMVIKLFLVMGIPWLFESISSCAIPLNPEGALKIIVIILDTVNCLQGVFIFCIFILKTTFIKAFRKKLNRTPARKPSLSNMSGATASSFVRTPSTKHSSNKK